MNKFLKFAISVLICEATGLIATPFTVVAIPTWYANLNKPFFSPPNWVFGPVWIILYFMMGVSAFLVLNTKHKKKKVGEALTYFAVQLTFNFLWSVIFFGFRAPLIALFDIVLLLVTIVATYRQFKKISRVSAYLLIPYLLWVSFATVLNFSIVILNK